MIFHPVIAAIHLPAYADVSPICVAVSPPYFPVLAAVLLEVLVVAVIIWRFRFNMPRLFLVWFGVSFLSFLLLLHGSGVLLDTFDPFHAYTISGVFLGIAVEAAALYWLSNFPYLRRIAPKPLPLSWAVIASVAGNLTSMLSFIGFGQFTDSLVALR